MINEKKNLIELTKYQEYMAKIKYDNEIRREDSLIQQAGHMQSAFSFTTAALFMATPVMFEYRGVLSFCFILEAVSSITFVLLLSLFAATIAQNRRKQDDFPDGYQIIDYIEEYEKMYCDEEVRNKYTATVYADIQKSVACNNNKRVRWIQLSMGLFYIAIIISVIWFIHVLIIIK